MQEQVPSRTWRTKDPERRAADVLCLTHTYRHKYGKGFDILGSVFLWHVPPNILNEQNCFTNVSERVDKGKTERRKDEPGFNKQGWLRKDCEKGLQRKNREEKGHVYCVLYFVYCIQYTVYCALYTVCCILFTVFCIHCAVNCVILYTVYCALYCILYIVCCIQCIVYCTVLCAAHYILCTLYCILYTVYCVYCVLRTGVLYTAYCVL